MFSLKKHEFLHIKFHGPALSQLLMYLILWSFQKVTKLKSVCVCMCVCVCKCVYKCEKSKKCYSCLMQNTTSRITLRNVTKVFKKIYHLYTMQNFTCLKCYYISSSIKMWDTLSHENAFLYALSFNSFMEFVT